MKIFDLDFEEYDGNYNKDELPEYIKWGFFDKNGLAIVQASNRLYTFINTSGEDICGGKIICKYINVSHFEDGFAKVQTSNELFTFINTSGKDILGGNPTGKFKFASDFNNGFALVDYSNKKYYINKYGWLFKNDLEKAIQLNDLILNKFQEHSMKFYIFRKIYDN